MVTLLHILATVHAIQFSAPLHSAAIAIEPSTFCEPYDISCLNVSLELIKSYDINKDGIVSLNEWMGKNLELAQRVGYSNKSQLQTTYENMFNNLDKNHNTILDAQDIPKEPAACFQTEYTRCT